MTSTSRPRHPYLDWPGPIALAHRGGASEAPENTLPAFQNAVDLGYTYLETDVHVTADGVVVAFHDDDLQRTAGRPGHIHEMTWAELSEVRIDGTAPIPRLDELLATFPEARFNIDCKTDRAVDALGDELEQSGVLDRVCVGAFSTRRLRKLRNRFGDALCTSAGPFEIGMLKVVRFALAGPLLVQAPLNASIVPLVTEGFVSMCHRRGLEVHVWTIDDRADMDRLLDIGVDGLMTDVPATLKDVLTRRGQWVG